MKQRINIGIIFFISIFLLGFDYSNNIIDLKDIHSGGPPQDGIPALYDPKFIEVSEADYLQPNDRVLGLYINDEAKAYPLRILNWHELVNDIVGEKEVLVSYCPLCGTGMAFESNINDKRVLFGVSGQLYNSNILFYDTEAEGLWSQIQMQAVTGPLAGTQLKQVSVTHTTWQAWCHQYPDTKVLSSEIGLGRNYNRNPYLNYQQSSEILFPVKHEDRRLEHKDWVVGIVLHDRIKAYSFEKLRQLTAPLKDAVGGELIFINFDQDKQSAVIRNQAGEILPATQIYWFAWVAFHPTTEVYY